MVRTKKMATRRPTQPTEEKVEVSIGAHEISDSSHYSEQVVRETVSSRSKRSEEPRKEKEYKELSKKRRKGKAVAVREDPMDEDGEENEGTDAEGETEEDVPQMTSKEKKSKTVRAPAPKPTLQEYQYALTEFDFSVTKCAGDPGGRTPDLPEHGIGNAAVHIPHKRAEHNMRVPRLAGAPFAR